MAIIKDAGRQNVVCASVSFAFADFTSGTEAVAIEVPQGAIILGGFFVIDTVFNSGTSDTITVGDATTEDRYKAAINGQAAALTALIPTGYQYTTQTDITITLTAVGAAATTGAGRLTIYYIVDGRAGFSQG